MATRFSLVLLAIALVLWGGPGGGALVPAEAISVAEVAPAAHDRAGADETAGPVVADPTVPAIAPPVLRHGAYRARADARPAPGFRSRAPPLESV
ncbi:MAG: hypothetical protein JJU40_14350 [Rhodobacteraceae bacterium]|nr:hypothetical protein [Paracoccaceae bacterium]